MNEVVKRRVTTGVRRKVPVAWDALEDAFENNASEVHSYLNIKTGEVVRVVEGVADPAMHARIVADPLYVHAEPVSSREQYRWMERFIETVADPDLRVRLNRSIDGKGAFRRFKDALMAYAVERERWFTFRSERLRVAIGVWLDAHDIEVVERPEWHVPTAEEVKPQVDPAAPEPDPRKARAVLAETHRARLRELVDLLAVRELDVAVAFLEFLRERRHPPRPRSKSGEFTPPAAQAGKSPPAQELTSVPDPAGETPRARSGSPEQE